MKSISALSLVLLLLAATPVSARSALMIYSPASKKDPPQIIWQQKFPESVSTAPIIEGQDLKASGSATEKSKKKGKSKKAKNKQSQKKDKSKDSATGKAEQGTDSLGDEKPDEERFLDEAAAPSQDDDEDLPSFDPYSDVFESEAERLESSSN